MDLISRDDAPNPTLTSRFTLSIPHKYLGIVEDIDIYMMYQYLKGVGVGEDMDRKTALTTIMFILNRGASFSTFQPG